MALVLTATQQATLSIAITDARGNPASVEGTPQWQVSDSAALSVTPAEDGMAALVKAVGPVADSVQVSVQADADLGEGVTPLVGVLDVQVIAGEAALIAVSAGTPEEQPTDPPPV